MNNENIDISIANANKKKLEQLLATNRKLVGLSIENDKLCYDNKSIDLNDFNLNLILGNNNVKLTMDVNNDNISAWDFFETIQIYSKRMAKDNKSNNNSAENIMMNYALNLLSQEYNVGEEEPCDIISPINYFKLISKSEPLSMNELKQVNDFEDYMRLLFTQADFHDDDNDYLDEEKRYALKDYNNKMQELLSMKINNPCIQRYSTILKDVQEEKAIKEKAENKLELKAGFANAFLVILLIIGTGILIGFCAFFFI